MANVLYQDAIKEIYTYTLDETEYEALRIAALNSVHAYTNRNGEAQNRNTVESVFPGIVGEYVVMNYIGNELNYQVEAPEVLHYLQYTTPAQTYNKSDVVAFINNKQMNYEVKTIKPFHARSQVLDKHLAKYRKTSDGIWFVSYDDSTRTATIYGYVCLAEFNHEVSLFERKISTKLINPMTAFAYWTGNKNPNMIGGVVGTKFERTNIVCEKCFVDVTDIPDAIKVKLNAAIFPDYRTKDYYRNATTASNTQSNSAA